MACAIEKFPTALPPCTLMQDGTMFVDAAQWLHGNGLRLPSVTCNVCTPTAPLGNFAVSIPSVFSHSLSPRLSNARVTPNSAKSTPLGQAPAWWGKRRRSQSPRNSQTERNEAGNHTIRLSADMLPARSRRIPLHCLSAFENIRRHETPCYSTP